MSNKSMSSAWDDDWTSIADKADAKLASTQAPEPLTGAQRRAQHREANRALWESADSEAPTETPADLYLAAHEKVPFKSDFKPAVKVLSRKPPPKPDPASGAQGRSVADDDDDSDTERRKQYEASFQARQEQARKEREEKAARYEEVRARLFGTSSGGGGAEEQGGGAASRPHSRNQSGNRNPGRGKGRGRGGGLSDRDASNSPRPSPGQSPARAGPARGKQLFDPSYTAKPGSAYANRREQQERSGYATPPREEGQQPVREPKGPDGSGRGGFGFGGRGKRSVG